MQSNTTLQQLMPLQVFNESLRSQRTRSFNQTGTEGTSVDGKREFCTVQNADIDLDLLFQPNRSITDVEHSILTDYDAKICCQTASNRWRTHRLEKRCEGS